MGNNKLYGYTPDPSKEKEGNRLDRLNPYEFRKGMDYELTALGCYRLAESTLEEREKSTEKVIKNLEEYGGYYSALIQYETEYRNPVEGQTKPTFKSYLKEIEDYQMIEVDKKYTHDKMVEPKYKKEDYTVPFKTGKMGNFKLKALKEAIKKEVRKKLLEGIGPSACPPVSCREGMEQHPVTCKCVRASSLEEKNMLEAKKDKDVYDIDDAEPTKAQIKGIDKSIGDAKEALAQAIKLVKELGPDIKKLAKEVNAKIKKNPEGREGYLKVYQTDPDVEEFIKLRKMLKAADLL